MSRKFLTHIDLSRNEIQNAVAQVLAADPGTSVAGQFYYNSVSQRVLFRNASAFIDYTARANHTGTQLASTISDFDTQVRSNRLDQLAVPTAAVSFNSQRITGVASPTADTDAANKLYVDSAVNGTDWKQSARVASTVDVPTLSGLLLIDGITLVIGDRVLLKNQTTASQNGVYVAATGAWTRALDADSNTEVTSGMTLFVEEGTTGNNSQWRLTTTGAIVVGTTALSFAQIGAGTSYTAGNGITIAGSVISVDSAVVVRKFATTVGDGVTTSIAVTHGLSTLDCVVQVYEVATGASIECDMTRNSTSQVTLGFTVAPATNTLRVVVQA